MGVAGGGEVTLEEAIKVAQVCMTVDGGCSDCQENIFDHLSDTFPMFEWRLLVKGVAWDKDLARYVYKQGVHFEVLNKPQKKGDD